MGAPNFEGVAFWFDPDASVSIGNKDILHLTDTFCGRDLHASKGFNRRRVRRAIIKDNLHGEVTRGGICRVREACHGPSNDSVSIQVAVCKSTFDRELGIRVGQRSCLATPKITSHCDTGGTGPRDCDAPRYIQNHGAFCRYGQSRGELHLILSIGCAHTIRVPYNRCLAISLSRVLSR